MFDKYREIQDQMHSLKVGEKTAISFFMPKQGEKIENYHYRFLFKGRMGIHDAWMYEGGLPYLYRDIDDSLSNETHHSRFSLKITADGEDFPRRAYYKIQCSPRINSQYPVPSGGSIVWIFSGMVKTKNLRHCREKGVEMPVTAIKFECFQKEEGRDERDISGTPAQVIKVPLPEGTNDWSVLTCRVPIEEKTAAVLVSIEVTGAKGIVWLEDFSFMNSRGFNILPCFDLSNRYLEQFNWMGENLSRKEWCDIRLTLNGRKLETAPFYQPCYAGAENEVTIPEEMLLEGENCLEIENVTDAFCPPPYFLAQTKLLWEVKRDFYIISVPEYVVEHQRAGILIKTVRPDTELYMVKHHAINTEHKKIYKNPGLYIWEFTAKESASHIPVCIMSRQSTDMGWIARTIEKEEDGIVTGSGDSVYIPQEKKEMEEFLCWYLAGHIGNMITFRPVYRWSGSRVCRSDVWIRIADLCNQLGLYYCNMIDGRELPGIEANPDSELLAGEYYLGNQGHEKDGAFYYWLQPQRKINEELYEEISRKITVNETRSYRTPIEYEEKDVYFNFSPNKAGNMEEAAGQFLEKVKTSLTGIKRHTGPSTLFKYFLEAGVEVCGAELMYGPHEVILSALRGASIAYHKEIFTAHLAVQWSTTPHESESHYRRYRLSLFISYLQGCHHINTEEGLYRMEEYFSEHDRFSEACVRHADVQRDFYRFVETHSRRGKLQSFVGLLHGRNDGWVCFTRRNAWSQDGEEWEFSAPEESWDLIKVFYPDSVLDAIYRHPCTDEPHGYYSRTPYGTVDILPVEASTDIYKTYDSLAFIGYNTAETSQIEKFIEFVENGGKLLLGWCHLCIDTDRKKIRDGNLHPLDASELTGVTWHGFSPEEAGLTFGDVTWDETTVPIIEVDGKPLLFCRFYGKGVVYFFNVAQYPSAPALRPYYENVLHEFGEEAVVRQADKGYLSTSDAVETAVYDRDDGHRVIYMIHTNWWSKEEVPAFGTFTLGEQRYRMRVKRDVINIVTIYEDMAVMVSDNTTDIISISKEAEGMTLYLQGEGLIELTLYTQREIQMPKGGYQNADKSFSLSVTLNGKGRLYFAWEGLIK